MDGSGSWEFPFSSCFQEACKRASVIVQPWSEVSTGCFPSSSSQCQGQELWLNIFPVISGGFIFSWRSLILLVSINMKETVRATCVVSGDVISLWALILGMESSERTVVEGAAYGQCQTDIPREICYLSQGPYYTGFIFNINLDMTAAAVLKKKKSYL